MTSQLRIGDAERDAAASALGEHYAAGRLTKDEYDERVDRVWAARFYDDLAPLFADLPSTRGPLATPAAVSGPTGGGVRWRPHPLTWLLAPLLWLVPLAMFAAVGAVIMLGAPWLLFVLFWFLWIGGFGRARWRGNWARGTAWPRGPERYGRGWSTQAGRSGSGGSTR